MLHKVVELIGEIIQCVNELDFFILLSTVRSVFSIQLFVTNLK